MVLQYGRKKIKNRHVWLSCAWLHSRTQTVAHFFLPSLDNAYGRLCQERLLRSRRFATIVTWRHTSIYNSVRIQNTRSFSVISMDCAVFWLLLDIVVSVNRPNRIVGVYECTVVWFSPSDSFCGIYIQSTKFVTCKSAFSIYIYIKKCLRGVLVKWNNNINIMTNSQQINCVAVCPLYRAFCCKDSLILNILCKR